jgi:hypothetical protein
MSRLAGMKDVGDLMQPCGIGRARSNRRHRDHAGPEIRSPACVVGDFLHRDVMLSAEVITMATALFDHMRWIEIDV